MKTRVMTVVRMRIESSFFRSNGTTICQKGRKKWYFKMQIQMQQHRLVYNYYPEKKPKSALFVHKHRS